MPWVQVLQDVVNDMWAYSTVSNPSRARIKAPVFVFGDRRYLLSTTSKGLPSTREKVNLYYMQRTRTPHIKIIGFRYGLLEGQLLMDQQLQSQVTRLIEKRFLSS